MDAKQFLSLVAVLAVGFGLAYAAGIITINGKDINGKTN